MFVRLERIIYFCTENYMVWRMVIENPPRIEHKDLLAAMLFTPSAQIGNMVDNINETFEYWDTIKYKSVLQIALRFSCGQLSKPHG